MDQLSLPLSQYIECRNMDRRNVAPAINLLKVTMRMYSHTRGLSTYVMLMLLKLMVLSVTLLGAPPVLAQDVAPDQQLKAAEEISAEQSQRIENLIKTLESDAARQALVSDLKALLLARESKSQEPAPELAEALKIDEAAQSWKTKYTRFLKTNNLDASLIGHLLITVAVLVAALVLLLLAKKIISWTHLRIMPFVRRYHLSVRRINLYVSIWRLCAYACILIAAVGALAIIWGIELERWIPKTAQLLILQAVLSTAFILALGALIIEVSDSSIVYFFKRKMSDQNARMNTLLPIARTILLATLFTLFGLTLLSQLGLNVMPLLAGAGVVGFAVGFGAQTLIKDVLTGFIVIIEDLIQVGDVAAIGGKSGLVEKITIRKVQLRDMAGTVFTVPFSEVSIVENLTKDFSYYLLNVNVAYRENTDKVAELLTKIDEEMRAEEQYKDKIMEPIEILGVDSFADSAVIVKARIKTVPLQQWTVGREFNRRMKRAFDEQGVEIPFPHRTLYFGQNKDGLAPPVQVNMRGCPDADNSTVKHSKG